MHIKRYPNEGVEVIEIYELYSFIERKKQNLRNDSGKYTAEHIFRIFVLVFNDFVYVNLIILIVSFTFLFFQCRCVRKTTKILLAKFKL